MSGAPKEMTEQSNIIKGRNSYDSTSTGALIPFLNRNVTPYATESSGPKFDMIPVAEQKDLMVNHARMFAQQEYDRIMQLVHVLEDQARQIKRRLEITDAVHGAEFQFKLVMGKCYWLVWERRREQMLLVHNGPTNWSTGAPEDYEYVAQVKYMGDHTWMELKED
jgi:hypothetical protein